MSLLFETILIENGKPVNLFWHEKRMNSARKHFFKADPIELRPHIPNEISQNERYRCRIEYSEEITRVFLNKLIPKPITSLQIVEDNGIEYSYKYCDRQLIALLYTKRKNLDDILVVKLGYVTDTSTANIVFTVNDKYFTPSTPLLEGTQRDYLISNGIIEEREIRKENLLDYTAWQHINALNPFQPERFQPMGSILW